MKFELSDVRVTTYLLLALALASCTTSHPSRPAADSGLVQLQGLLEHPGALSNADLLANQHQQGANFDSHEGPQSHVYQGVSLFGLLEQRGMQSEPKKSGGLLDRYLVATGADGYQAVFSVGEIWPEVGHQDSLVATRLDSAPGAASIFYTTAPGDAKGGRYVANLASIELRAPATAIDAATVAPGSVQISGALDQPLTLDAADLGRLPQSAQQSGALAYSGVSLWALLSHAGLRFDTRLKNPLLSMVVVAQGRDGYRAIFSVAELSPDFGNKMVLLSAISNQPGEGPAAPAEIRLLVPGDANHSRSVRQLITLTVESAAPGRASAVAR